MPHILYIVGFFHLPTKHIRHTIYQVGNTKYFIGGCNAIALRDKINKRIQNVTNHSD